MTKFRHYFALALLLLSVSTLAEQDKELRVLFVGNSYTYYWNMPLAVSLMTESLGKKVFTKQSTVGNTSLENHWKGEMETQSRQLIEQGDWDYVVFNNHSLSAEDLPESFLEYSKKFADLARSNGAQPVFYMTWARQHNLLMQPTISNAYMALKEQANADVVPVGELWMQSIALHPDKNLYDIDRSHPSSLGAYLTALTFAKYFTGLSVQDVPDKLYIRDSNGDRLFITMISPDNADFFRDLVDSFNMSLVITRD